jgi:hypothetical protein
MGELFFAMAYSIAAPRNLKRVVARDKTDKATAPRPLRRASAAAKGLNGQRCKLPHSPATQRGVESKTHEFDVGVGISALGAHFVYGLKG